MDVLEYDTLVNTKTVNNNNNCYFRIWQSGYPDMIRYPQRRFVATNRRIIRTEDSDIMFGPKLEQKYFNYEFKIPIHFKSFKNTTSMNTKPRVFFSCYKYGYDVEKDMDDDVHTRLMNVEHFRELDRLTEKVTKHSSSRKIKVPKKMRITKEILE